jgi:hypothetical protein
VWSQCIGRVVAVQGRVSPNVQQGGGAQATNTPREYSGFLHFSDISKRKVQYPEHFSQPIQVPNLFQMTELESQEMWLKYENLIRSSIIVG